ncbi:hypothetical protein [Komagataeibacter sp. FNDCR2]|uniref:hypothetical protein n=1 Tax=Komagataeibacter sp. FNDCR2 TaxID=2878682 RepID=UPI001E47DD89|nr:hypothetical protein [Komagataeibacter sp. FNDCR2]MCE2574122.1 hypothetical protein [Komagataeibacter sp. FNDCR2]
MISAVVGGLVLLALIVMLIWRFVFPSPHIPIPATHTAPHELSDVSLPASTQHAASNMPASAAIGSGNAGKSAISLATLSLPEVVRQAPDAPAIGAEGERRLASGKPDDGLRLMEAAADRGDTQSMENLGRLYDPAYFKAGGPIPAADEQEAARYYQQAAKAGDTSINADRARLQASLKQRADDGDSDAALTLESYFK